MAFPINRPRRLRRTDTLRRMVRETRLSPDDFIQPFFVCPGRGVNKPVGAMPGVAQMSVDIVVNAARETFAAGVPAVSRAAPHPHQVGDAAMDEPAVVPD